MEKDAVEVTMVMLVVVLVAGLVLVGCGYGGGVCGGGSGGGGCGGAGYQGGVIDRLTGPSYPPSQHPPPVTGQTLAQLTTC